MNRRIGVTLGASVAAIAIAAGVFLLRENGSSVEEGDGISQAETEFVGRAKMAEGSLRRLAQALQEPEYPEESIASGVSGTAVASVLIGTDGSVEDVTILETPDPHIGEAVEAALREARFPPIDDPEGNPL
jgi:TonB family protein